MLPVIACQSIIPVFQNIFEILGSFQTYFSSKFILNFIRKRNFFRASLYAADVNNFFHCFGKERPCSDQIIEKIRNIENGFLNCVRREAPEFYNVKKIKMESPPRTGVTLRPYKIFPRQLFKFAVRIIPVVSKAPWIPFLHPGKHPETLVQFF